MYSSGYSSDFVIIIYLLSTAKVQFPTLCRNSTQCLTLSQVKLECYALVSLNITPLSSGLTIKGFHTTVLSTTLVFVSCASSTFKYLWGSGPAEKLGLKSASVETPGLHS